MSAGLRLSPHYKKLLKFQGQEELALECSELVIQDDEAGIEDVRKICELLDLGFQLRIEGTKKSAVVRLEKKPETADEEPDRDPDAPTPPPPPTRMEAHILRTAPRGFAAFYAVLVETFPSKRKALTDLLQRHMGTSDDFSASESSLSEVSSDDSDDSDAEGKEAKEGEATNKADEKGGAAEVDANDPNAPQKDAVLIVEEEEAKEGEAAKTEEGAKTEEAPKEEAENTLKEAKSEETKDDKEGELKQQTEAPSEVSEKRERSPDAPDAEVPNGKRPCVEPEDRTKAAAGVTSGLLAGLGEDDVDDDD